MARMELDVLAFAAHPDDVELFAGGTVALLVHQGYRVGICDLTRGELGSRGTPEVREREAEAAAAVLGLSARVNLGLPDGDIRNTPENRRLVAGVVRRFRPRILLVGAPDCRHPDHAAATQLAVEGAFAAGLRKIETPGDAEPWRPQHVLHYMQSIPFEPTMVVDVTDVWETRIAALRAFASQFHHPDYVPSPEEPETFVSNPAFFEWIEARARTYGYRIGATYGEPLLYRHGPIGVTDLMRALDRDRTFR